jgi:hypothetical protein
VANVEERLDPLPRRHVSLGRGCLRTNARARIRSNLRAAWHHHRHPLPGHRVADSSPWTLRLLHEPSGEDLWQASDLCVCQLDHGHRLHMGMSSEPLFQANVT